MLYAAVHHRLMLGSCVVVFRSFAVFLQISPAARVRGALCVPCFDGILIFMDGAVRAVSGVRSAYSIPFDSGLSLFI
jgi:hypothetical protein